MARFSADRIMGTEKYDKESVVHKSMHPMLLLVIVVVLCAICTYVIPAGTYQRTMDQTIGRELIIPGSFEYTVRTPATPMKLLMSLTLGLQNAADIIFFLLITGGMFAVINGNGALNIGMATVLGKLKGKEVLMVPLCMIFFGLGSAFLGCFEEYLAFVPLLLACSVTVGMDSLVAVGIIFIAATAGYAGPITNSFTLGTAQQIAGLEVYSGMPFRIGVFVVIEILSIAYVTWYAVMIRKNPKFSGCYEYDREYNAGKRFDLDNIPVLTLRQGLTIVTFIAGMVFAAVGVIVFGFYVDELAAVFLAIGVIGGLAGGLRPGEICKHFINGCRDMVLPVIMIGLANAAVILLRDGNVLDTMLFTLGSLIVKLPSGFAAFGMFVAHEIINVAVPSGSAQAALTMPLMVPLAERMGVSGQTAVLAYHLGDAFTNVYAPTGGEILAALAICRVPFSKWLKFLTPLFILWWVASFIILMAATMTGF